MQLTLNERWELHIGKTTHIISGEEMKAIIQAGEARFVRFRDLIINPAFVTQIILVDAGTAGRLEAPDESDTPSDEWLQKHTNPL